MRKKVSIGLGIIVVMQFSALVGMYVQAVLPLHTGVEVSLKTAPVDPRSLFRGNYVQLNYSISRISAKHFPSKNKRRVRKGEVVYVRLVPDVDDLYEFSGVSLNRPEQGVFLRGRIRNSSTSHNGYFRIRYGIEAFFAPKEKALELEKLLRQGAIARLMVSAGGKARLKTIN